MPITVISNFTFISYKLWFQYCFFVKGFLAEEFGAAKQLLIMKIMASDCRFVRFIKFYMKLAEKKVANNMN